MKRSNYATFAIVALMCFGSALTRAQLLKVDINTFNQSGSANTAPGYVAWNTIPATNQKSSATFTNVAGGIISCTVSQTVPAFGTANTVLKANWGNKNGQNKYQLSFDGVWTHNTLADIPYTNGGAFCLIISNLPPARTPSPPTTTTSGATRRVVPGTAATRS